MWLVTLSFGLDNMQYCIQHPCALFHNQKCRVTLCQLITSATTLFVHDVIRLVFPMFRIIESVGVFVALGTY